MEVSTWSVLECMRVCVCVCVCVRACTGLHLCATQEEATATVYRHFVVCTAVNHVCWLFGVCYWKAIVFAQCHTMGAKGEGQAIPNWCLTVHVACML